MAPMWSGHAFADMLADGADRWALLESFVAEWHGRLSATDGIPVEDIQRAERRLAVVLPESLRIWYRLAGRREELNASQDELLSPARLHLEDDTLVFCVENQWAVVWGVQLSSLGHADPPVWISDPEAIGHKVWLPEAETLSDFALSMTIRQTLWGSRMALALCDPAQLEHNVLAEFVPLLFQSSHWPRYPTAFYAGTNAIALTCPGMVQVAARNEATLSELLSRTPPGVQWERERP